MLLDESELWNAYRESRTEELRNELAARHLPLVERIARALRRRMPERVEWEVDDLVGFGCIGLLQAIERFDVDRGWTFATFATPRILGSITDALRHADWVPRQERRREKDGLVETRRMQTFDFTKVRGDGEYSSQGDYLVPPSYDAPRVLEEDAWRELLRGCSQRERLLLLLYYREELPMAAVGRELGISESRVSQIMSQTITRLRLARQPQRPRIEETTGMLDVRARLAGLLREQGPLKRRAIGEALDDLAPSQISQTLSRCPEFARESGCWVLRENSAPPR